MNALIYSGPEVEPTSVSSVSAALRPLLFPHYAVQTVSQESLSSGPWQTNCALLVLPEIKDVSFLEPGKGAGASIQEFIRGGGSLLTLSCGAKWESITNDQGGLIEMQGKKTDGLSLMDSVTNLSFRIIWSRLALSDPFTGNPQTEVRVLSTSSSNTTNAILCSLYSGKIAVWAPSLDIVDSNLLKTTLISLGMETSLSPMKEAPKSLPQYIVASRAEISKRFITTLLDGLDSPILKDANDTFEFIELRQHEKTPEEISLLPVSVGDANIRPKKIILCRDGSRPLPGRSLSFKIDEYFADLSKARLNDDLRAHRSFGSGFGEVLMYSECVTSTQTLLDKNPSLLARITPPLLSVASQQITGRGRGANVWVSPAGCLMLSLVLKTNSVELPLHRLVFVQYLFALAITEACRDEMVLGRDGDKVRLKWPNDIYAIESGEKRKIGGVLVNLVFEGSHAQIVLGCGLNVLTKRPLTSLSHLVSDSSRLPLTIERTVAILMVHFDRMWSSFLNNRGSFEPFMDLYIQRWLHTNQLVSLTTIVPHQKVRIQGITPDHGLLRTLPDGMGGLGEGFIDLQPDGNSFDMLAGLIKTKT